MPETSTPIAMPSVPSTGFSPLAGPPIGKLARLKVLSPDEWEEFVVEWASSGLANVEGYAAVHRAGSAGDKGRDVIAYLGETTGQYDNYQCKRYDHALYPSDVWLEIGKLCYWTFYGAYTMPRRYWFVSPQGPGTTLIQYFEKPELLKSNFLEAWEAQCARGIVGGTSLAMTDELRDYVLGMDFAIFGAIPPLKLIEQHATTPYHLARFGGGFPTRIDEPGPPDTLEEHESRYIEQLLGVYGEHANCVVSCAEDLSALDASYSTHLKHSREEFYSAECLGKFSRDWLPPGSFEALQQDVEDAVREVVSSDYDKSLTRVKATISHAKALPVDGHPLSTVTRPRDKAGICHQLVNDKRMLWLAEQTDGS